MNYLEEIDERRIKMIEKKEKDKKIKEENAKKMAQELGLEYKPKTNDNFHGDCDHPNTMENSTATVLYIIVMIFGAIFVDRWLIWILASVIYFSFITRHHRKK